MHRLIMKEMIPSNLLPIEQQAQNLVNNLEVPFQHVEAMNASMRLLVQIGAIYGDDQYKEDPIFVNKGP